MKMPELIELSSNRCFGGYQKVFSHESSELRCQMNFAVYLPPQSEERSLPVIYWLSGLTCTEQNFIQKAGAQRYAAAHGVIIVCPDTSPRGVNLPGEGDSWDFGSGAGFYVDSVTDPWQKHYRMYSYVTKELPDIINTNFPVLADKVSIMGHSMGGHGALICALKNPGKYRSVSAFAPICNPINCPWGKKAFTGYLGVGNILEWQRWDATELVKNYDGPPLDILIDQGVEDQFLKEKQLLPENFVAACQESHTPVVLQMCDGYDHSYYFIASFIGRHIEFHMKHLNATSTLL
ncbi:S-formylglutathione hydrolase isoform X1 [Schistocerca serialis cubense]|uniref:S-formylglutathione hydrolase isoform X1 n=2 Tax=Schistocerca serialis cubense TaxID=2023355 RepID=UPI00214F2312|nr:S-formylglutathione hydrolase isoform X1 [Schistocerca serialis cubense]